MSIRSVTVLTFIALFVSATVCASGEIYPKTQILKDGVKTAETYWNAQKVSDAVLFRSVTPHESMNVVFEWSYVNKSDVLVEEAPVASIKSDIQNFFEHHKKYDNMPKYTEASITELEAAATYATRIEKGCCPMLGNLLKKGYWSTIIPSNFSDMNGYRLMTLKYIADVKVQSKEGTVLQKRTTLHLYRMQADSNDSGWKVFFVEGLYNLPPL
jgi:hypothetical protein